MEHYQTLGVDRNATPDDIKRAYRKLANQHHPDKGGDTAMFQKIQTAYETLSDPQKKQEYDNPNPFGQGMPGGFHFNAGGPFGGGFNFNFDPRSGMDINDMFGQFFGQQRQPQKPIYKTTVWVTLEQVLNGDEQILQFRTHSGNQTVRIEIPKGVDNGGQMRYDNLVPDATLIIEFRVHQHEKFRREGLDLYSEYEISVLDLIVGTDIEFTALSGNKFTLNVRPKTQPNTKLRIVSQGLQANYQTGDQYVLLKPIIPDRIDNAILDAILQSRFK
jgi:DnaJ-class molecular chaperone